MSMHQMLDYGITGAETDEGSTDKYLTIHVVNSMLNPVDVQHVLDKLAHTQPIAGRVIVRVAEAEALPGAHGKMEGRKPALTLMSLQMPMQSQKDKTKD